MNVTPATFALSRAIVGGTPVITEQPINGNTPRVAGRPLVPEGVTHRNLVCRLNAVAFAYPQDTRLLGSGQRTGRVNHTQDRAGAYA